MGQGDGTFQAGQTYATGLGPWSLALGDFNGDGQLDLAVAAGRLERGECSAGQRGWHLPGRPNLRRRLLSRFRSSGRLQRRRPPRPSRHGRRGRDRIAPCVRWGRGGGGGSTWETAVPHLRGLSQPELGSVSALPSTSQAEAPRPLALPSVGDQPSVGQHGDGGPEIGQPRHRCVSFSPQTVQSIRDAQDSLFLHWDDLPSEAVPWIF